MRFLLPASLKVSAHASAECNASDGHQQSLHCVHRQGADWKLATVLAMGSSTCMTEDAELSIADAQVMAKKGACIVCVAEGAGQNLARAHIAGAPDIVAPARPSISVVSTQVMAKKGACIVCVAEGAGQDLARTHGQTSAILA